MARYFADHSRPRGAERVRSGRAGRRTRHRSTGPATERSPGSSAPSSTSHDGGDHEIFLGSVLASGVEPSGDALLFFGGGFHQPQTAASPVSQ